MAVILAALASGVLFGLGLTVSQMVNPAKVLAFLDLFGRWDPSLLLVMGGALVVTGIGYRIVFRRRAPLLEGAFRLPEAQDLDARLLAGAALFGIGWGLVGLCPGPAIAGIAAGAWQGFVFLGSMVAGAVLFGMVPKRGD
jgi:uncharacterized protein